MKRIPALAVAALIASGAVEAAAQNTRMTVRQDSKLTLAGSSNVHDWSCKGADFQATIELDSSYASQPLSDVPRPIAKVVVDIPVKSLKCGKAKMDENMYKALRANEFKQIRYELVAYTLDPQSTTKDAFIAQTEGQLTVAGKSGRIAMPLSAVRGADGSMKGEGSVRMRMTDVGIKPPVALLGTLRTKDEIEIKFEILLDKAVAIALMNP